MLCSSQQVEAKANQGGRAAAGSKPKFAFEIGATG
jgi:hypothetical protein